MINVRMGDKNGGQMREVFTSFPAEGVNQKSLTLGLYCARSVTEPSQPHARFITREPGELI